MGEKPGALTKRFKVSTSVISNLKNKRNEMMKALASKSKKY
jgi:hypothetical protein